MDLIGLNYRKLKAFQLSILWRAGVAQDDFFSKVDLAEHAEPLREMLLSGDPGRQADYGCTLIPVVIEGELLSDLIVQPETKVGNGFSMAEFVFGGHVWLYLLGSSELYPLAGTFLQEDGRLPIRTGGRAIEGLMRRVATSLGFSHG